MESKGSLELSEKIYHTSWDVNILQLLYFHKVGRIYFYLTKCFFLSKCFMKPQVSLMTIDG